MAFNIGANPVIQATSTFSYLRFTTTLNQPALTETVVQPTETFSYLRFTTTLNQPALTETVVQPTETFSYLRFISGNVSRRDATLITQLSNVFVFLFYRPFIASSADLIPLYQTTPQFGAFPYLSLDGMPQKDGSAFNQGNNPETKLVATKTFPFGTNLQGVPREDIVKEWGKLYTVIDNQDITLFRNSDVIINSIAWSMLGYYETLEITVPAVTSYDNKDTISWLYNGAAIDIYKEKDDVFDILWRGTVNGWALETDGIGLKITAHGLMYDLTYHTSRPQKDFIPDRDAGYYINKTVNEGKGRWNYMLPQNTGETTNTLPNYQNSLDYIRTLTTESETALWVDKYNNPYLVKQDEREPLKPNQTTKAEPIKILNYINGQDGLVDTLSFDQTSEATIEYATGSYPKGGTWANWVFPQVENIVDGLMYATVTGGIVSPFTPSFPLGFPLADINASITPGTSDSQTMIISSFPSSLDAEDFPLVNIASIDSAKNGNGITTMYYAILWWKSIKDYGRGWGSVPGVGGSDPNFRPYPDIYNDKGTYTDDLVNIVKEIQADNGLPQTGDVDIKTWSAICRVADIASDAWIAPVRARIHPNRTRLIEKYSDIGISRISHKYPKGFTQEQFLKAYNDNKVPEFFGSGGIYDYSEIIPLWVGEIELTLCPPIVEDRGDFGNGSVSRFDIKPRDILKIWQHPGSYKEGFFANDRYIELFISRVEWDLSGAPKVRLQVATKPFEYSTLFEYINQDL